ncbi:MAG: AI-2E family transporter [Solirubrobacterales bacterium]
MQAARIQGWAVVKVVTISLFVIAAAVLLALVVLEIRTTLRWALAAVFLALALAPAVTLVERVRIRGHVLPRWLAILVVYVVFAAAFVFLMLHVIRPIIAEVEALAPKLPGYVKDFEQWARDNEQFRELNQKFDITQKLSDAAASLPSKVGDAASDAKTLTVSLLNNLLAAITILVIAFFLLIDGDRQFERATGRFAAPARDRWRRIGDRIYAIVKGYVTVNVTLAAAVGVVTWLVLEILGVPLAVPLGVIVAFLDLIPLIGLTMGGLLVAIVVAFHDFPTALIVWGVFFLIYQQLQDRVIQPLMYKNAVKVHPVIAIVAILIGAELLGILGALLAIPIAASIGVLIEEALDYQREHADTADAQPTQPAQPEPAGD